MRLNSRKIRSGLSSTRYEMKPLFSSVPASLPLSTNSSARLARTLRQKHPSDKAKHRWPHTQHTLENVFWQQTCIEKTHALKKRMHRALRSATLGTPKPLSSTSWNVPPTFHLLESSAKACALASRQHRQPRQHYSDSHRHTANQ